MKVQCLYTTDDRKRQIERVSAVLIKLGVPRTYRGFEAALAAVWLVLEDESLLRGMMQVYTRVAEICGQSRYSVERNIRTVVKRAWSENPDYLTEIAGYPIRTQPTSSQFIDFLARDAMRCTS